MENFSADKPINVESEDKFQRYGFAKRIAETIINRKSIENIVFGLYGAWGEGKSSILHFIDLELQKDESIVRIHFNPWRYSDEEGLLKNFFSKIATSLNKELNNRKEKLGKFIETFGGLGGFLGGDISSAGKLLNDIDIEGLKERVEAFLKESDSKLVVFIDDVDRLDKQEIYALLRLVKLTADFAKTTYILAFDEKMVAAAIAERFGAGGKKEGENFLEKIVQIPLIIPKAQIDVLQDFCFDLINKALDSNNIKIEPDEVQRFVSQFTTNISKRLNTPRLAVRYGNSLSFLLPLLNGEVSVVDLMLIEAIKIFYPNYYDFIKSNPKYFIESYTNKFDRGNDNDKIKQIKDKLDFLGEFLSNDEQEMIKDLLSSLFPHLDTVFGSYHYSDPDFEKWYQDKRIASEHYFNRYFAYTVIRGEVSDLEFTNFLNDVNNGRSNLEEITKLTSELVKNSSPGNFIMKLRSLEKTFDWNTSTILFKVISNITDQLPQQGKMMDFDSPFSQATAFIFSIFKRFKGKENIIEEAKELMIFPKDFKFSYNLNNYFRSGENIAEKLFTEAEYIELAKLLVDRAIREAGDESIFEKFEDNIGYLIYTWSARDKNSFTKYVNEFLERDEKNIVKILRTFVPTVVGITNVKTSKTNIDKKVFESIISYLDMEEVYQRILKTIPLEKILSEPTYWDDLGTHEFTDINMLRQFVHFYNQKKVENSI